ncbi:hypothetical protein H4R26_004525 [Coemansia thaxteri]|uniref:26S proteasome non-ATPase regulatory subunit 5 n=1 Tax=Coemansia thaxteri TaxID=2663907 RepID=A0A9W8EHH4_9FUNG|nr:hypothetical protein H4R26_004525 [Coemansia thaxteri]KAJ2482171.1 hypothetical protein EV174_003278 [Coemansia sp. RSA 2320]
MLEKEYHGTIKQICTLLQSEPTSDVIHGLREAFESLSKQLKAGPFLEVFETTLSNIPFAALFSLLAAPDNRLVVTVAEVTGQLLKPVTWAMVHQTFEEYIIQGLDHPHPVVKCLVLDQFLKCEQATEPFSLQYGQHIWGCLESKSDNDATKLAKKVLEHLSAIGMAMDYLLTGESMSIVRQLLASASESQRFRVYDVVTAATANSESAFEFFRQEGIVDAMLKELSDDDVLVTMNLYELIPALCTLSVPYEYLDTAGVFRGALEQINKTKGASGVTESLLRVAGLKLFSRMVDDKGVQAAAFLEKYAIVPCLGEMILAADASDDLVVTAINCLGAIGNSSDALEYLATEKTALKALVSVYGRSIGYLRIECLKAIACIFGHSATPNKVASQACYNLYESLADGKFLMSLVKEIMKGFEESCVAGLAVVQKMALHAWGVREIASYQNIVGFLLMRDPSRGRLVQQWQFAAIETIANSKHAEAAFDADTFAQIQKYVKDGPFYASVAPQVALKSS